MAATRTSTSRVHSAAARRYSYTPVRTVRTWSSTLLVAAATSEVEPELERARTAARGDQPGSTSISWTI